MNSTQIYLSIGIPTLTVILTTWATHRQVNRICANIDCRDETISTKGALHTSLERSPR